MPIPLLELKQICKSYGPRELLEGIDLSLSTGERLALIGKNGVGKSTLIKIALGLISADSGSVRCTKEVGYLPQEWEGAPGQRIDDYLQSKMGPLQAIQGEMRELEELMAKGEAADLERYGALQEEYERRGGYTSDHRMEEVLEGVGLKAIDQSRLATSLSGGEQSRLMLAGLLLLSPDLLILDEPTNHLDLKAMAWLEEYLSHYQGAVLTISHDRAFLDKVVNRIGELRPEGLRLFFGNYQHYLEERERLYLSALDHYKRWRDEVNDLRKTIKETTFSRRAPKGPKDKNIMAYDRHGELAQQGVASRINQAKKRLEELEASPLSPPRREWDLGYRLEPKELASELIVETDLGTILKGERVVITGPNGSGKTTLLNRIYERKERVAQAATIGYLDQMQALLNPNERVIDSYSAVRTGPESELRSELHKYGLFGGEEVFQQVETLSSGQKQKLQLARCIAMGANLLLLDEPTNHLDLESIERLERALVEYPVTVIAVSHDRRFVERIATKEWNL